MVRIGRARGFAVWRAVEGRPAGSPGRFSPATIRVTPSRRECWPACGAAFWLVSLATLVAVPSESVRRLCSSKSTAREGWLRTLIEINLSNLAGVPSIVYGILGMAVFVKMFGAFRNHRSPRDLAPFHEPSDPATFRPHGPSGRLHLGAVDSADRDCRLTRGLAGGASDDPSCVLRPGGDALANDAPPGLASRHSRNRHGRDSGRFPGDRRDGAAADGRGRGLRGGDTRRESNRRLTSSAGRVVCSRLRLTLLRPCPSRFSIGFRGPRRRINTLRRRRFSCFCVLLQVFNIAASVARARMRRRTRW